MKKRPTRWKPFERFMRPHEATMRLFGCIRSRRQVEPPSPVRASLGYAKAGKVGYLTGLGRTSDAIATELADGTHPSTVRSLWTLWGIGGRRKAGVLVPLTLSTYEARTLQARATDRGMTPEEWIRRVAAAAIRDEIYLRLLSTRTISPMAASGKYPELGNTNPLASGSAGNPFPKWGISVSG
jgi:hypothetical protein